MDKQREKDLVQEKKGGVYMSSVLIVVVVNALLIVSVNIVNAQVLHNVSATENSGNYIRVRIGPDTV
jgi:hypothetical protein